MSRRTVEARAYRLLNEHHVTAPPVQPDVIAKDLGAEVIYEDFDPSTGISGVLVREDDRVIIGVNSRHVPTRQRFTIAHEMGHFLMHPGKSVIVEKQVRVNYRDATSSMATSRQEIEANQFAAALLMPEKWVSMEARQLAAQDPGSISEEDLIGVMSRRFEVSPSAMGYRLVNLGILASADLSEWPR